MNYRVATEGKKSSYHYTIVSFYLFEYSIPLILKEPDGGLVELVYQRLAPTKLDAEDIFVFWDKKCLNYGQDWEKEFLNALITSTAIILLISNKVASLFKKKRENNNFLHRINFYCFI